MNCRRIEILPLGIEGDDDGDHRFIPGGVKPLVESPDG